MAKHLLVAITGHGYGHAAQTAPVVAALRTLHPDLRLSLRSDLPAALLAQLFPDAERVDPPIDDFGFPMRSAIDVDVDAAEQAFAALHRRLAAVIASEAEAIGRLRPDLVLANVGFVPIAGAARAGIPAIGFSSLNWLGIARAYSVGWRDERAILAGMAACYRQAQMFVRPTPAMKMPDFVTDDVGPVARAGKPSRRALATRLGLAAGERIVLVSLGGIGIDLGLASWPHVPGVRYVVAGLAPPVRADMADLAALEISHVDCLASCDAVVTKPGYGTVAEAACHAIPTLYVRRGAWPEEPHLVDWLETHGTAREIPRGAFDRGDLGPALDALWAMPRKAAVPATGNEEAARLIAARL
jgi:hypothetical protein